MKPRDEKIKVLIVDDHQVVRQGLRTFLELHDDIVVVGEAADGVVAVEMVRDLRAPCGAHGPHDAAAGRCRRHQADHGDGRSRPA